MRMSLFNRRKKPIIVTIHGFGRNLSHEFDSLARYLKAKKYEVIQFDMYDLNNPNDANYKDWVQRCEAKLGLAIKENPNVTNFVSQYNESFSHIVCPMLMLHGTSDEVIAPSSSSHAYKKIPAQKKRLIYIEGAKHRMLYDGRMEQTVFTIIEQMLENRIF